MAPTTNTDTGNSKTGTPTTNTSTISTITDIHPRSSSTSSHQHKGNIITNWVFRRSKFCCCLPVRLGTGILSALSGLFSGFLSIVLWYEVSRNYFTSGGEKTAFVIAGLVYTLLFIASFLGFIGTCAHKLQFLMIYAIFLYIHIVFSVIVGLYFLVQITHGANTDIEKLCEDGLRNDETKSTCTGVLKVTKEVYWVTIVIVLGLEIYSALVVTRYVNNVRYKKREKRQRRKEDRESAYEAYHKHMSGEVDEEGLLNDSEEFDPYGEEEAVSESHEMRPV